MLQVTETAAIAFKTFLESDQTPGSVIRLEVAGSASNDSQQAIRFTPAEGPVQGDIRADAPDVDIYVAQELSEPLDDALLDAQVTPEGAQIVLRRQGADL